MSLSKNYISPTDVALSSFVKALALPVRIGIVRFILENGNTVTRAQLSAIPYNRLTVNQHINELRHLNIISLQVKGKESVYSVNESVFIKMSNHFLTLFDPIRQLNNEAEKVFSKPRLKRKAVKKPSLQILPFGQYLRDIRKQAQLSQAELADRIKMDRAWVSKVETNKQALRAEKLDTLAKALNTPVGELRQAYYQSKLEQLKEAALKDA